MVRSCRKVPTSNPFVEKVIGFMISLFSQTSDVPCKIFLSKFGVSARRLQSDVDRRTKTLDRPFGLDGAGGCFRIMSKNSKSSFDPALSEVEDNWCIHNDRKAEIKAA